MKSCPKCNRTFPDEGQKFCTFDGGLLIAPQAFDPNATIRATSAELAPETEKQTSRELPDPNKTIVESYPTVALTRDTGPTGTADTGDISSTATMVTPPPPPPPPAPPTVTTSPELHPEPKPTEPPPAPPAPRDQAPASQSQAATAAAAPPVKKKSKLPLILAGVVVFLLIGGVGLAALVIFVVKPKLDAMSTNRNSSIEENNNTNSSTNTNTQANTNASVEPSPAASPVDDYVPPANAVAFTSSKENLDGKLAEHYFDFSFYYPNNWKLEPKPGANFVVVERSLPPKFPQENFSVAWYTSTGTFVGDLPGYPKRVEQLSASIAKQVSEFSKVSEGPTRVNSLDGYEFRWTGSGDLPEKGPVKLWGRVVFLPTGTEGDTTGATLIMYSTSLATELQGVDDLGEKGETPMILKSFRFGKKK